MEDAEQQQLVATFGALHQAQAQLLQENQLLRAQLAKEVQQNAESKELIAYWKEEAARSSQALTRNQALLEKHVGMLAMCEDISSLSRGGTTSSDVLAEANQRVTAMTQQLDQYKEQHRVSQARLEEVTMLHADRARLEQELSAARASGQRNQEENIAPVLATADMWKRRYQETRDLLGKSEIYAKRRDVEYQMQLSALSRQYQQCKVQADRLYREYKQKEQQQQMTTAATLRHAPANHFPASNARQQPTLLQQQADLGRHARQQPLLQRQQAARGSTHPPPAMQQQHGFDASAFDSPAWSIADPRPFMPMSYANARQG
jgi:hypothetical protein